MRPLFFPSHPRVALSFVSARATVKLTSHLHLSKQTVRMHGAGSSSFLARRFVLILASCMSLSISPRAPSRNAPPVASTCSIARLAHPSLRTGSRCAISTLCMHMFGHCPSFVLGLLVSCMFVVTGLLLFSLNRNCGVIQHATRCFVVSASRHFHLLCLIFVVLCSHALFVSCSVWYCIRFLIVVFVRVLWSLFSAVSALV